MSEERVRGFVREYGELEGFGWIDADGHSDDVFVHVDDLQMDSPAPVLAPGERVEFRVEENEKGFQAREVRVVEPEA